MRAQWLRKASSARTTILSSEERGETPLFLFLGIANFRSNFQSMEWKILDATGNPWKNLKVDKNAKSGILSLSIAAAIERIFNYLVGLGIYFTN